MNELEQLRQELAEERYRHDRLQDWDRGQTKVLEAAVADIKKIAEGNKTWMCPYCKHARSTSYGIADCDIAGECTRPYTEFEWRGMEAK